ncbi:hypothetical protein KAT08_02300 [Candidatus Babeliales bacterium]|nr:hypothetical protein [Candidatus Babeliales bacterium]
MKKNSLILLIISFFIINNYTNAENWFKAEKEKSGVVKITVSNKPFEVKTILGLKFFGKIFGKNELFNKFLKHLKDFNKSKNVNEIHLDFSNTEIKDYHCNQLRHFEKITELFFSRCHNIKGSFFKKFLGKFNNIRILVFNESSIKENYLQYIPTAHLEELDISDNKAITGEFFVAIKNKLTKIKKLDIYNCSIKEKYLTYLPTINLEELDVSYNIDITGKFLRELKGKLIKLKGLWIDNCSINDEYLKDLPTTNLKELQVTGRYISGKFLKTLNGKLIKLEQLSLDDCNIEDEKLENVPVYSLKQLLLRGNKKITGQFLNKVKWPKKTRVKIFFDEYQKEIIKNMLLKQFSEKINVEFS